MDCYIINLSHTQRTDRYVTFWRPDEKGYAWPLSWAGKYPEEFVRKGMHYLNSESNMPVPCSIVDALAVAPVPGTIDGDAGPVVLSNRDNWLKLISAVVFRPKHLVPRPLYKGARRTTLEIWEERIALNYEI